MSMRIRAILVIVLTNTVIILLSILAGTGYVREHIETYIESDMMVVADIADRFLSAELAMLKYEAGAVAEALAAADRADWADVLAAQARRYPKYAGMAVITRQGETAAGDHALPPDPAMADKDYIRRAFAGKKTFSSTVPAENGVVFHLASPIPGESGHILLLTLDGMYFSELASRYHVWETGHIFIDDRDGYIIANIRPEWVRERQNFVMQARHDPRYEHVASIIRKLISGASGIDYYSMDGVSRICAYRPVSGSEEGWALGIVAPLSESPASNVNKGLMLIALVSFLLNVAAALVASRFIKKPFEDVAALKERAEAGLREHKIMMAELEQRDHLVQTVNQSIDLLLRSEPDDFPRSMRGAMGRMARSIHADRVYLHKNYTENGKTYNTALYEWPERNPPLPGRPARFFCDEASVSVKDNLCRGESVHSLVRDLPPVCRECLGVQGALSIMVVPVFLRDAFWGFVGFDNCHSEHMFSKNAESTMRSGSLLLASALLRHEYMLGLKETSVQLEGALADAEKANNAKSDFLAHMSHEIRTPLNAVIGLSELTLGEGDLSGEAEANLEKIYGAGATILSIVNDILDISKIESGKLEAYPVLYDTPSLINDVVTLNIVRIGEKPIRFTLSVDERLPGSLYGDDLRVKQIFNNLLSNAFKYTNAGTVEWRISFERENDSFWLVSSIRDSGIGIRAQDMPTLFADYHQMDRSINRSVQGTGLGLAITRRLVEMMDGSIEAESEYGKGSVFHVRLRQICVSDMPIGKAVADNLMSLRYILSKRGANTTLLRTDLSYAHLLVVDDISTNLDVVKGMLKPYGLKIDCAASGRQAIEMIRAESPRYSAVFMDHMMPAMDGIEATRIIREEIGTEYARSVPIIALTANALVGNEELFLRKGFQDFISKPIDMGRLDAVLRRWVRDKDREKEQRHATIHAVGIAGHAPESEGNMFDTVILKGVDTRRALERFNGDDAVLLDVLHSYARNTRALLGSLQGYLDAANLADYAIVIHGIKGSSYGIFAQEAGKAAEELETTAKAGDLDALRARHPSFAVRTEALLDAMDGALAELDAASGRPVADRPDPALLTALREACRACDMDSIDAAMARLEAFRYLSGGTLVAWLRERIESMTLEDIANGTWPEENGSDSA